MKTTNGISAIEISKRNEYWKEKKSLLASTNFHVNVNRICIRGLNKQITEKELKKLY